MTNRHIVDRALPERAYLKFYFPQPTEGNNYYAVTLPFFENVKIRESKKARYKKYSLVSRSSNLYSYLGADSRVFDLTFNLSLPHLLEEHPDITSDRFVDHLDSKDNLVAERERFKAPYKTRKYPSGMAWKLGTKYTKKLAKDSAQQVITNLTTSGMSYVSPEMLSFLIDRYALGKYDSLAEVAKEETALGKIGSVLKNPGGFLKDIGEVISTYGPHGSALYQKARVIDLIIYWVNIVRSSLVNNANNPIYGPPVVRLNHGIMYQNIPCICTNYNIDFNEAVGYDVDTLLPRQIRVTMKLEEFRTGNFGEFEPKGTRIERDNLAGWEAVVLGRTNSMDPGE